MIITRENERLYLTSWNYNAARIISELAKIVVNNGGKYKPTKTAIISNRSHSEMLREYETKTAHYKSIVADGHGNEKTIEAITRMTTDIERLKKFNNEPIQVTHTSYISFILDGFYYYYQVDDNPFFEFYYSKTPIVNGKHSMDAAMTEDKKEWLFDCFFKVDCSKSDIVEAANLIFNMLVNAKKSPIIRDSKKQRVPNIYDGGYHYETIYAPERLEKIDF